MANIGNVTNNSLMKEASSFQREAQQLIEQMRNIASGKGGVDKLDTESNESFSSFLKNAVDEVNKMQKESGSVRKAYEMGDKDVTLTEVILAVQKARVASNFTIKMRNHLVEAYQNIMNMPV